MDAKTMNRTRAEPAKILLPEADPGQIEAAICAIAACWLLLRFRL
jgi:hypothetical protein